MMPTDDKLERLQSFTLVGITVRELRSLRERARKLAQIETLKVWTNEDGKEFIFADDVREVLGVPTSRNA